MTGDGPCFPWLKAEVKRRKEGDGAPASEQSSCKKHGDKRGTRMKNRTMKLRASMATYCYVIELSHISSCVFGVVRSKIPGDFPSMDIHVDVSWEFIKEKTLYSEVDIPMSSTRQSPTLLAQVRGIQDVSERSVIP